MSLTRQQILDLLASDAKLDELKTTLDAIKDTDGVKKITDTVNAQLTGSTVDLRGLATSKPGASTVDIGVTYWSVDTGVIEVSDGTNWVVV